MYMFQSLKSFKIKALCTKSETLKRLCPIELINCNLQASPPTPLPDRGGGEAYKLQFIFVMKTFIPC